MLTLWILSVLGAVLLFVRSRRTSGRVVATLLAVHWTWSAVAYHVAFFIQRREWQAAFQNETTHTN